MPSGVGIIATISALAADHDDLIVDILLSEGGLTITDAAGTGPTFFTMGATDIFARYTKAGQVFWTRDMATLGAGRSVTTGAAALSDDGDILVPDAENARVFRLSGTTGSQRWSTSLSPMAGAYLVIPRRGKGDFLTLGGYSGQAVPKVGLLSGDGMTFNVLSDLVAQGGISLANGRTYFWGRAGGTLRLNPFSAMTWMIPQSNVPSFIVGDDGSGSSIGPWFSEGESGPEWSAADDRSGNLFLVVSATTFTRINGQDLASDRGIFVAKLDPNTGTLLWKRDTSFVDPKLVVMPTRDAMVVDTFNGAVVFYDAATGATLSSFSLPGTVQQVAAGTATVYVVGKTSASADFDPGTAVDQKGSDAPAIYISQYSF